MEEKIVKLDDNDLDSVVGGAFNQNALSNLGLEVKTGKSGTQGVYVKMEYSSGHFPNMTAGSKTGWTSDENLKNIMSNDDNGSVSAKTTTGEMKPLTKSQIGELLS